MKLHDISENWLWGICLCFIIWLCIFAIICPEVKPINIEPFYHNPYNQIARLTCYGEAGTMANGEETHKGVVAVSDRHIKLGTKIKIRGVGEFTIEDRTNKRFDKSPMTIDIFDPKCNKSFGVKYSDYYLENIK